MSMKHLILGTSLSLVLALPGAAFAANSANIDSKKLLDADVHSPSGDRVGEIEGVLLDNAGKTQAVVVDVGGFLGVGEHRVALNWKDLAVLENGDKVTTKFSKDQLKAMPEYNLDKKRAETAYYDPEYRPMMTDTKHANATDHGKWAKAAGNLKGSELIGADIVNAKNDTVGSVKDVLFDTTGKIKMVLVDPQGVFGGGTKTVAMDLSKMQIMQSGEDLRLATTMTEEQLKALPEYGS
jgi:uncharacterized protein YrrD